MNSFDDAHLRAVAYWHEIADRRVSPSPEAIANLTKFREPLPEKPSSGVIRMLDEIGSPATVGSAGGRYFGFVTGGALPDALSANWLAAAWDQNSALNVMSPVANVLEEVAIGWIIEALRLPANCGAAFVTGATMANFTGLAAARHALLAREGWDVEEQGMFGAPPITVIVGPHAHASLLRAVSMLGLGRGRVSDDIPPRSIVCLQAGDVNTGAFDLFRSAGAWVHVDGAFGLWARVSPAFDHLTEGYEQADSWALDCHKWLNVNYDSAIVLTRDPAALPVTFSSDGAYLIKGKGREAMNYSPEMSRRARAIDIWAAMKSLGREGLVDLIDRTCAYARRFAEGLQAAGHEILNDVVINQVLVRFGDDEKTRRVIAAIQEDGTCWCGGTVWNGKAAMRISVSSWRTTAEDVEKSLAAMLRLAA